MKIMESYQIIVPNNINKTFLIEGSEFQNLRDFFYYCCYSFIKSSCDHSINHVLYLNSTQLTCEYPKSNTTEEFIFELKKHSHAFDNFVEGPIILFEYNNHNVSHLDLFKEHHNHYTIITVLLTFICTSFAFVSMIYCIWTMRKNQLQKLLSYEEL